MSRLRTERVLVGEAWTKRQRNVLNFRHTCGGRYAELSGLLSVSRLIDLW